jgi:hypothetical protein
MEIGPSRERCGGRLSGKKKWNPVPFVGSKYVAELLHSCQKSDSGGARMSGSGLDLDLV